MLFHVLNRGAGRRRIFDKEADYAAFEAIIEDDARKMPRRIRGDCLMPNHWHYVMWPEGDDDDFEAVSSRTSAMRAAMSDSSVSQEHMKRAPPAPMKV